MHDRSRFNLLLTQDRPRADEQHHWSHQLPRLLRPQGVVAYVASTGRDAIDLAERTPIHAAVIDMGTPRDNESDSKAGPGSAGFWLLELFQRLPKRPPIVLLRMPPFSRGEADRLLREALRLGVFSVMNKPVSVEQLLAVFRRLVDRRYQGSWPREALGAGDSDPFSFPSEEPR